MSGRTPFIVGSVSAADPDDGEIIYSIDSGNGDGKFSIDSSTGQITVAGILDYDTTPSYTLTVQATVEDDATSTTEVRIAVVVAIGEITLAASDLSPVAGDPGHAHSGRRPRPPRIHLSVAGGGTRRTMG